MLGPEQTITGILPLLKLQDPTSLIVAMVVIAVVFNQPPRLKQVPGYVQGLPPHVVGDAPIALAQRAIKA
jgi:hypothetical protein